MPEYPTTRLDRALAAAIARDSKIPRQPLVLCRVVGPAGHACALADGHSERVAGDHKDVFGNAWPGSVVRTEDERRFWDEHGFWPDDMRAMAYCVCLYSCSDDPATSCSLSGEWHVHPNRWPGDVMGPCPVHPDAPGDL